MRAIDQSGFLLRLGKASESFIASTSKGLSLLEAAIAIGILSILSIGLSNMLLNATENQMHETTHVHQQSALSTLAWQIRMDGTNATAVTRGPANNDPNRLTITQGNGDTIDYFFNALRNGRTTVVRRVNNAAATEFNYLNLLPAQLRAMHQITCGQGFTCVNIEPGSRISVRRLWMLDVGGPVGQLEVNFGKSGYMLPEISVSTMQNFNFN